MIGEKSVLRQFGFSQAVSGQFYCSSTYWLQFICILSSSLLRHGLPAPIFKWASQNSVCGKPLLQACSSVLESDCIIMCRNLICPEIQWMGSSCLVTALSISRLERKLHAGLLLLQAGGFLCNPHYDWKVNSSAAGQSILGRLSVGEAASGRGERNECEASHPVTAPSPIFSPFAAHVRQSGCTSWELWELLGMAGPGG